MSKVNTKKMIRKIIMCSVLLFIVLPVAILFVYRKVVSFKIRLYAKEYLADTYDFEWSVGKVNYDLLQDYYEVAVYPEGVPEVQMFILYASPRMIFGDGFMEAYAAGSLKLLCEERMKEIWGEDSWVNVKLYSPDLRRLSAEYSMETSLETLLSDCKFFRESLTIESKDVITQEQMVNNMWESILFFKEVLPIWSDLGYHVAGEGKFYFVEGWFENITGEEDLRDKVIERKCYPY